MLWRLILPLALSVPVVARHACTMWEFSWMLRRSGNQSEYADWAKVLDEAVERGYNCLRIDAFPHLVAAGDGNATVLPQPDYFMWGNNKEAVTVNAQRDLVAFMSMGAQRGLSFGLSTWLTPDTLDRRGAVRTPGDLVRIWNATLHLISSHGLLGHVLWVDVLNEFPVVGTWAPGVWQTIFRLPWPKSASLQNALTGLVLAVPWKGEVLSRANAFLTDVIPVLRRQFPHMNYTYSFQGNAMSMPNVQKLNTSEFDIAELHLWLSDNLPFMLETGETAMFSDPYPKNLEAFAPKVTKMYPKNREKWVTWLLKHIDMWHDWAETRGLPVITTEAWGPINYDDVAGDTNHTYWNWVKDIGEVALRHALCQGWLGVATSNFAEPHFKGMWVDVPWHQNQTATIRNFTPEDMRCGADEKSSQHLMV